MVQSIDFLLLDLIQSKLRCKFLDSLMPKISALGDGGMLWIVISLVLIAIRDYRTGIMVLTGLLTGVLIGNVILKNTIARPRPCWINQTVTLLIPMPRDYSFPSCHTLSSFMAAIILTYAHRSFGYAVLPMAGLIAFSRLYLYVHYPSDILGGIAAGAVIARLVCVCSSRFPF